MKRNTISLLASLAIVTLGVGCGTTAPTSARPHLSPYGQRPPKEPAHVERAPDSFKKNFPTAELARIANTPAIDVATNTPPVATATKAATPTTQKPVQFGTNGMVGGFECLFQNNRSKDVTVTVTDVNGYKYTFDIKTKQEEVIPLLPGEYTYIYEVEGDQTVYPVTGTLSFPVTKTPTHGFKGKKAFNGGLHFRD